MNDLIVRLICLFFVPCLIFCIVVSPFVFQLFTIAGKRVSISSYGRSLESRSAVPYDWNLVASRRNGRTSKSSVW